MKQTNAATSSPTRQRSWRSYSAGPSYGRLKDNRVRQRAEVVEYRVEQYVAKLGERLAALRARSFGTASGTVAVEGQPSAVTAEAAMLRA